MAVSSTSAATAKTVSDVLNFTATATEDTSASQGSYFAAQGDTTEQTGYLTAEEIARQNAALEEVSGRLQATQQEREVRATLGTQQAQVAGAGFGASGSALALARASRQQGYLAEQITGVQSDITAGGFQGQAAAAASEASAAGIASTAATTLAQTQAQQGQLLTSYAAAEAKALATLTGGTGPVFNPTTGTWTQPTPDATIANSIATTTAAGGKLTPDQLGAAAIVEGGGTPTTALPGVTSQPGASPAVANATPPARIGQPFPLVPGA